LPADIWQQHSLEARYDNRVLPGAWGRSKSRGKSLGTRLSNKLCRLQDAIVTLPIDQSLGRSHRVEINGT